MRLLTCHRGRLHALFSQQLHARRADVFGTGLPAVDELLPEGGLPRGAVHEILASQEQGLPLFFAMLLARAAGGGDDGEDRSHQAIVWCDPARSVYPPALAAAGIHLDRLYLLRPRTPRDLIWAMAESLRCPGVAAAIAAPARLSRVEARRLQLAAETGQGAGILLRTISPGQRAMPPHYAAATRWRVSPQPGDRTVQRWKIQLIHCHGGNTEQTLILEHCRETNSVRAAAELVHRLASPKIAGA